MRAPHKRDLTPGPGPGIAPAAQRQSLSLLLIEDDRADAVLVENLIADAVSEIEVRWAPSMAHAERELASTRPDCVLLDLNLPDADGMDALARIAERDATVPIVVLTGLNDEYFGATAVAAGAQDYLVKGRVEPEMLRRALLYAIERKRAELIAADLHASRLRARENALLERGLLPSPLLLDRPGVDIVARYRPSREDALLCGDFYDVVQTPDRVVHVLIGDVAGHGPNEAALGAALRIAWRALTLASVDGVDLMRRLEQVLRAERTAEGVFATVLSLTMRAGPSGSPHGSRIKVIRAGHPGMLLHGGGTVEWLEPPAGPALGLHLRDRKQDWPQHELALPAGHGLLLITDGLFEGYSGSGRERLGEDGLLALARSHAALPGPAFVDALIDGAQQRAQSLGGLTDDIAVLRVERTTR
ncbi:PP2C family protein-serine/threonine phosphatase [Mycobacterium ostraviense]|uniref:Fused response regulator/phosphatase n=1 Tax=Mycobacterium ostraviense TaxID=2738409 RepID=A0A163WY42_9MYCO|nr:SpoIIE family protein phosphatase [Mycobacterium ostraviense]KZS58803.1 fused response regulator/phosphatase [Mycobacterium ostraviense]UGT90415.1 SpoIIE family protein phosphatase [Mycobacterium ostraviense]